MLDCCTGRDTGIDTTTMTKTVQSTAITFSGKPHNPNENGASFIDLRPSKSNNAIGMTQLASKHMMETAMKELKAAVEPRCIHPRAS